MSSKNLLEEATVRKFMKLANIDQSLRENFTSNLPLEEDTSLDERAAFKRGEETEGGGVASWSTQKTRSRDRQQQDETTTALDETEIEEAGCPAGEMEEVSLDALTEEDLDASEIDISEEDARALMRIAKALEAALGVEEEEEEEDIEIEEPEEEEEIEIGPEGEEAEEEEEEEEEIMQEAIVKKIAARVAQRLLKEKQ